MWAEEETQGEERETRGGRQCFLYARSAEHWSGKEEPESTRETGEQRRRYQAPRATGELNWEDAHDGMAGKRNAESGRAGIPRREPGWGGGRQPHAELKNCTLRRDGKGGGGGFGGGKGHRNRRTGAQSMGWVMPRDAVDGGRGRSPGPWQWSRSLEFGWGDVQGWPDLTCNWGCGEDTDRERIRSTEQPGFTPGFRPPWARDLSFPTLSFLHRWEKDHNTFPKGLHGGYKEKLNVMFSRQHQPPSQHSVSVSFYLSVPLNLRFLLNMAYGKSFPAGPVIKSKTCSVQGTVVNILWQAIMKKNVYA